MDYANVFADIPPGPSPDIGISQTIFTGNRPPIYIAMYRMSPQEMTVAEAMIRDFLQG